MKRYERLPIGRLQAGDEVYERKRDGSFVRLGTVASAEKRTESRDVRVQWVEGGGFTQNWAAKLWRAK